MLRITKPFFSHLTPNIYIYHLDQIDLHKKAGEMIYTYLTSLAMTASKLQVSLNNIHSQLKLENMSYLAKDTKIKALEDLFLNLGLKLKDVKVAEEIVKRSNANI